EHDAWIATRGPVSFELDPGGAGFPHGWVLFTCQLSRTLLDGSARLLIDSAHGEQCLEVPVSRGGLVYELVRLPRGVRRVVWQPSQREGAFRHSAVRMQRVST